MVFVEHRPLNSRPLEIWSFGRCDISCAKGSLPSNGDLVSVKESSFTMVTRQEWDRVILKTRINKHEIETFAIKPKGKGSYTLKTWNKLMHSHSYYFWGNWNRCQVSLMSNPPSTVKLDTTFTFVPLTLNPWICTIHMSFMTKKRTKGACLAGDRFDWFIWSWSTSIILNIQWQVPDPLVWEPTVHLRQARDHHSRLDYILLNAIKRLV